VTKSNGRRKIEFPWQSGGQREAETTQFDADPWGRSIGVQTSSQEPALLDPNTVMATVMPVAVRKKKRSRPWDKRNHASRKYRGIPAVVHSRVKEIAGEIHVSVSEVAQAFMEYGLSGYSQGALVLKPKLQESRFTLYPPDRSWSGRQAWKKGSGSGRASKSALQKKNRNAQTKEWEQEVAYRIPTEVHAALLNLAESLMVPVGEVVTSFFAYAITDYESGELEFTPQPKATKRTLYPE
jgi:hypothetical protein